uniref:Uncharacterized protein n=1 Tax=Cannabis sativa TaxID=3483 RepID=A0A803PRR3_CANSA
MAPTHSDYGLPLSGSTFGACTEYLAQSVSLSASEVATPKASRNCPTTFNTIMGRLVLVDFGAITSIKHLCLKFFTNSVGVGIIRGNQEIARKCYNVATKQAVIMVQIAKKGYLVEIQDELDPQVGVEASLEPMEEVEKIQICGQDPTKVIRVGKGLNFDK